jgi:type IV pilus assembly protein PilN
MYGLDVNFLKDRAEYSGSNAGAMGLAGGRRGGGSGGSGGSSRRSSNASSGGAPASNRPLIIGAGLGLGALALSGLAYGAFLFQQNGIASETVTVSEQLGDLEKKEAELKTAKAAVAQAQGEIVALTSVFSNIKPWSAMTQDLRDRLPQGIQITEIAQEVQPVVAPAPTTASTAAKAGEAGKPAPVVAPPPPLGVIKVTGQADNFDKVNDFLVVLQKSNFLDPKLTTIVTSELQTPSQMQSFDLPGPDGQAIPNQRRGNTKLPKLPPKVSFTIKSSMADVPTAELLRELDRKGAVGLVARIEALKEKGVIKP